MNKKYDKSNIVVTSSSISLGSLLGVAFIVLKLCNVINWSWGWVLAPFWIPVGVVVLLIVFGLVLCGLGWLVELYERKH